MTWDSTTAAAAAAPIAFPFFALAIDLPAVGSLAAKSLRLLDGAGFVSFSSQTFVGQDPDYGSWSACDAFEDGVALQSSRLVVSLNLLSDNAVQQVSAPASQGSPVTIYLGFMNRSTGAPVAAPVVMRAGYLDVAKLSLGMNTKGVDLDVTSAFEFLMLNNDGERLCSAFHNTFYPTETGFDFVDNVTHQLPWGQSGPRPDQVTQIRNYDTGFTSVGTSLHFGGLGGLFGR